MFHNPCGMSSIILSAMIRKNKIVEKYQMNRFGKSIPMTGQIRSVTIALITSSASRPELYAPIVNVSNPLEQKKKKKKEYKPPCGLTSSSTHTVRLSDLCTVFLVSVGFVCTQKAARRWPLSNTKTYATRPKQWPRSRDPS